MSVPAVSVLIPSYNKATYLEETLASVYVQSWTDYELIVVDDGSTDGSAAVLARHAGKLTAITQPNQGASAARARALREARGRYIQYLDADDQLLPSALESRVRALEQSGADVAYSDWQRLRRDASGVFAPAEIVARTLEQVDPEPEVACFAGFWSPPVALMYTRAIVERMPAWSSTLPVIQDARYLFDAAHAGARFVHVAGVSALYREDADASLSRGSRPRFLADVARNASEVEAIWRVRGLDAKRKAALVGNYEYIARVAFRDDDELFDHCIARIRELGDYPSLRWPVVAARLRRYVGKRRALQLLRVLRRPAP